MKKVHPIRLILPHLLTWVTGKTRYLPNIEWSGGKLFTHDVCRAFEWLFFREYGIRAESTVAWSKDEDGRFSITRKFHTAEALIAHIEGETRLYIARAWAALKGEPQTGSLFPRPALAFVTIVALGIEMKVSGNSMLAPLFAGALAYDSATASGATNSTSFTYSHTTSGSDRWIVTGHNTQGGDVTTGVTYSGAALTQELKSNGDTGSVGWYGYNYIYNKIAPATGANNVVSSASGSGWMRGGCSSFTGVSQVDAIDVSGVTNQSTQNNSLALTVTGGVSNPWMWSYMMFDNSTSANHTVSAGGTKRAYNDPSIGDSNGVVSGTHTFTWNSAVGSNQRSTQLGVIFMPPQNTQYDKTLDASTTASATLAKVKTILQTLSSGATATATMTKVLQYARTLSSGATATASLLKEMTKTLEATVTGTAEMIAQRVFLISMNASTSVTASITKTLTWAKTLGATATATATLARQLAINKTLDAGASIAATLAAGRIVIMEATVTATATISTAIGKTLTASVSILAKLSAPFWKTKYPAHGDGEDYEIKYPHE